MLRAQIVTAWTGAGTPADPYRPAALDTYQIAEHTDATNQPVDRLEPDPNAYTIEVVVDQATLDAMDADGVPILWAEEVEP